MRHVTEQSHRKKSDDESRPSNIFPMLPQPATIEDNKNPNLESEELAILDHITHERQTYELVHRLQNDDVYMAPIIKYLDKGRFETYLPYAIKNLVIRESNKYCLHNGILYTKADEHGRIQLVVPLQLRSKILEVYHDSVFSTHPGHREMAAKVAKQYFWNGMNGDISNYVNNCNVCQLVKRAHKTITPPLGPHPVARTIGERWSLDFLERLRPSKDGYRHVVIAVEHVTRFVLLEPLKTLTAEETCEFLFKRVFMVMGLPNCILTDNGAAWRSQLTQTLLERLGVDSLKCLAYHSQANGMAERFLQKLQRKLQLYLNERQDDWSMYVAPIQYSMNNSFCRTLGMEDTPYSLMFGRDARTSLDLEWAEVSPYTNNNIINNNFKIESMVKLADTYRKVSQLQEQNSNIYKRYYDAKEYNPEIRVGDRVMLKVTRSRPNKSRALTKSYEGPMRVLDVLDYAVLIVPVARPDVKPKLVSKRRLKLIKSEGYTPLVQQPVLEFWHDMHDAELLQNPHQSDPDDEDFELNTHNLIDDSVTAGVDEVNQLEPLGADILAIEYPDTTEEPRTEQIAAHNDIEEVLARPPGLRQKPKRKYYGDDFEMDVDQLRVLRGQESWALFM